MKPTFLILMFALWTGLYTGCTPDPCNNIRCVNGSCDDGRCDCDPFYEGTICDVEERIKFYGSYQGQEICPSGAVVYAVQITEGDAPGEVVLSNLRNSGLDVYATIDGVAGVIPEQAFGQGVLSAELSTDTLTGNVGVELVFDDGNNGPVSCLLSLERQ